MIKLKDLIFERDENDSKDTGGVLYCYGDNKFLLCKGSNSGEWNVPKGHIMKEEDPLEGSVREFTEETQIILNGTPELVNTYKKENGGKFYLYMLEGEKRFIPHLDHEHVDWGYFDNSSLPVPTNEWIIDALEKLK
jgi:8-oxo-dGTP pyrophosphatase MutT (NUDIX family)